MKLTVVIFGVLAACAVSYAVEHGPLITMLQPQPHLEYEDGALVDADPQSRQKRGLLLGAALLGAGVIGAKAGLIGAGVIGAKAGLVGGALAAKALHGRSYGGYYGGYSGYGGFGGGYGYYGSGYHGPTYRSYPTVYVEHESY